MVSPERGIIESCRSGDDSVNFAVVRSDVVNISSTADLTDPLRDEDTIVGWIAEVTQKPEPLVRAQLRAEYKNPGSTVARALREAGIAPYTWSDDLARFYEKTDAFLYELVIWNLNRIKIGMRQAVAKHLEKRQSGPLQVLNIGDGLGIDSVYLARAGHQLTYFEVPGFSEAFARNVFAACGVEIAMLTNPDEIPHETFDAVICLDVLEHVPDPPAFVRMIARYLRPGGTFIVNAPFAVIHHTTATHLKSNRRYSGSLALYKQAGFSLLDGELSWTPLVLQQVTERMVAPTSWSAKRLAIRLAGCFLALGRYPILPLWVGDRFRRYQGRWFGD